MLVTGQTLVCTGIAKTSGEVATVLQDGVLHFGHLYYYSFQVRNCLAHKLCMPCKLMVATCKHAMHPILVSHQTAGHKMPAMILEGTVS